MSNTEFEDAVLNLVELPACFLAALRRAQAEFVLQALSEPYGIPPRLHLSVDIQRGYVAPSPTRRINRPRPHAAKWRKRF